MSRTTYRLEVSQDEHAESPADNGLHDEDIFLVYEHRQFSVREPGCKTESENRSPAELREDGFFVFMVDAYIHSGVSLSLAGDRRRCMWDTSTTGWVAVSPERLRDINPNWRAEKYPGMSDEQLARVLAKDLVDEWNNYLGGNVWMFTVWRDEVCSLGHTHSTSVKSCGGFYGNEGRADAEAQRTHRTRRRR